MINSKAIKMGNIELPNFDGELAMIPFDLKTLSGLPLEFVGTVKSMLKGIKSDGVAYFTIHGKTLKKGETLRRGGAHTDGNYEPHQMCFGGGGWKVGQEGRDTSHPTHIRQFNKETGGIILASNFHACNGWVGNFEGKQEKGGDCTHIDLGDPFELEANAVYYGNNNFIHESLPMSSDIHRVFARITMPENHIFNEGK